MNGQRVGPLGNYTGIQLWLAAFSLGLALWLTVAYLGLILELLWILFGALLFSIAMRPPADYLRRRHIPAGLAVIAIYLVLFGVAALAGGLLVPLVREEVALLQTDVPGLTARAFAGLYRAGLSQWLPSSDSVASNLMPRLNSLIVGALSAATDMTRLALDVLVVLVLAYFLTTEAEVGQSLLARWRPSARRVEFGKIVTGIHNRLGRWMWAQLALAAFLATVLPLGLKMLGVPFALSIGLLGGILELVPFLGVAVAAALAIVSALTVTPWLALWVILFYIAVFAVESHVLAPVVYGRVVGLHSVVVLLALFIGAKTQGLIGALFAVPVAIVLLTVVQELHVYHQGRAGDEDRTEKSLDESQAAAPRGARGEDSSRAARA